MKIAICGPGRHGKDKASEYLASISTLRYTAGTSLFAAGIVYRQWGFPLYDDVRHCFDDRSNHREKWAEIIGKYNADNGVTAIYRECLEFQDILSGLRWKHELLACRNEGIVDLWIWIDASKRINDPDPTIQYGPDDCDIVVPNNGTLFSFYRRLFNLAATWSVLKPEYE